MACSVSAVAAETAVVVGVGDAIFEAKFAVACAVVDFAVEFDVAVVDKDGSVAVGIVSAVDIDVVESKAAVAA